MISITNAILLKDFSLGMALELLIIIALIVLFIVSLCGLLQKIKRAYQQEASETNTVTVSQVYVQDYPPNYTEAQGEESHGVYPGGLAPPSYIEQFDPPPKYDDIIKDHHVIDPAVLQLYQQQQQQIQQHQQQQQQQQHHQQQQEQLPQQEHQSQPQDTNSQSRI